MAKPRLLLFSDLDGTLLDHDSYDWSPAKPALERLAAADILAAEDGQKNVTRKSLKEKSSSENPLI